MNPRSETDEELWTIAGQDDQGARAEALYELSLRSGRAGDHERAAVLAESCAAQFAELGRPQDEAWALFNRGNALYRLREWNVAEAAYLAAAERFRIYGGEDDLARAQDYAADAAAAAGNGRGALALWDSALALYVSLQDWGQAGVVRLSRGEFLGGSGAQGAALPEFEEARELFRRARQPSNVARADDRIAAALIDLGRPREALTHLTAALDVTQAHGDRDRKAYARYRLGWIQEEIGQHEAALAQLSQAEADYREVEDSAGIAACWARSATAIARLGRDDEAVARLEQAEHLYDALGLDGQVVQVKSNRAEIWATNGDLARAATMNAEAVTQARVLGDEHLEASISSRLAENLLGLGEPEQALSTLQRAGEIKKWGDDRVEGSRYRLALARSLTACGHPESASIELNWLIEVLRGSEMKDRLKEALALRDALSATTLALCPAAPSGRSGGTD
jgi:tetratricopeptide (TPR) repeat protein